MTSAHPSIRRPCTDCTIGTTCHHGQVLSQLGFSGVRIGNLVGVTAKRPHSAWLKAIAAGLILGSSFTGKFAIAAEIIGATRTMQAAESTTTASEIAIARQEIEYLRRWYARATDLLGVDNPESIIEGRTIYHRIFTRDAVMRYTVSGAEKLRATGADEWADIVHKSLRKYVATQHLIGTQLVEIEKLSLNENGNVIAGEATMSSYLQAWHAYSEDLLIVIGTYQDKVRFTPGKGWQIYDMNLVLVSEESRALGHQP
jgi:hypothetical protein